MNKLVLIPSAKRVLPELEAEFGPIPSALIPLDSRPALHYIAERYARSGYRTAVAVHEEADLIHSFLRNLAGFPATAYEVGETASLGQTILNVLHQLPQPPDRLLINFGDTLVEDALPEGDVICFSLQTEVRRWTTFLTNESGDIVAAIDKDQDKCNDTPLPVFVGVFLFQDPSLFTEFLEESLAAPADSGLDPFYAAVVRYHNRRRGNRVLHEVRGWNDFGHLDTYYATKRSMFMACRHFNQVRVDVDRGILRKSSTNGLKLANEGRWYANLPASLQHIAPRVFDCQTSEVETSLELEFYSYPALNDLYLFGRLNVGAWRRIVASLEKIVAQMQEHRPAGVSQRQMQSAMYDMYERKTRQRLMPVLDDPRFARFAGEEVILNDRACLGLEGVLRDLPRAIREVGLYDQDYFTVIHGDLCLSNILYDRRNGVIRLIDPRGEFGPFDIYGDPRYDLAKLCHSFEGEYDFLNGGMVRAGWVGESFRYTALSDVRHKKIQQMFHQWASSRWGDWYPQIKLIESLLFLSMVPLHSDQPQAQQVFLAKGLEIYSTVQRAGEWLQVAAS
jgi:hypothetical protein